MPKNILDDYTFKPISICCPVMPHDVTAVLIRFDVIGAEFEYTNKFNPENIEIHFIPWCNIRGFKLPINETDIIEDMPHQLLAGEIPKFFDQRGEVDHFGV